MPIIDILIAIALLISVAVGIVRGFIKEAISIAALLIAIWAALYFGPGVGEVSESWISSAELQTWFGRILVFAVILALGGLTGWGISKLVRLSVLSGIDRMFGAIFGVARGVLFVALFILGGQFAGFDNDSWWQASKTIPYFEVISEWIKIMAPQGYDMLIPDAPATSMPIELN
ncbi:MAG: CvpA family protein [Gammaproteobacteria bacterium]|nr:CvpA family protein [Gammaproteobacteria bacterium]